MESATSALEIDSFVALPPCIAQLKKITDLPVSLEPCVFDSLALDVRCTDLFDISLLSLTGPNLSPNGYGLQVILKLSLQVSTPQS